MTKDIAPPGTRLRVGVGYDAHRLARGLPLTLGGVAIAHDRGPSAHSDGDVLAHAIGDALLGAVGLGDLGEHFPNRDARWRGASSLLLLERIREMLDARGDRIVNVDATLIAEAPRIRPHVAKMRDALGRALRIEPERVSVKATTNEGLGALGREEGIAAHAVALVEAGGS
ncbi:MAG TPA: 2-C-methyl-D-erythritol 2,4-cyclodiphosphate synthase [Candidatus Eisenbacteria bacterium]|nr:2-C-methyl-D-erythritol 2,4-cyclodiphosphate synthase [Candidatus Eisenbacteria bacterium]